MRGEIKLVGHLKHWRNKFKFLTPVAKLQIIFFLVISGYPCVHACLCVFYLFGHRQRNREEKRWEMGEALPQRPRKLLSCRWVWGLFTGRCAQYHLTVPTALVSNLS